MESGAMDPEERRLRLEDGIRVAMALSDGGTAEMRRLLGKLRDLEHEYRSDERENRRLYVGSSTDRGQWHEVRESRAGTVYCKCPSHAFKRARVGDVCKHVTYVLALGLEVPRTPDLV